MNVVSKFMATTAVFTLIGGAALAQTAADPTVGAGVEPEAPTVAAGAAERTAPDATAGAQTGLEAEAGFTATTERLQRGERVDVVSMDGISLGHLAQATRDDAGTTQYSIALDPVLETNARSVTFIGMADVDADGRIVLPMAQEEFVSQIQAQFGEAGG